VRIPVGTAQKQIGPLYVSGAVSVGSTSSSTGDCPGLGLAGPLVPNNSTPHEAPLDTWKGGRRSHYKSVAFGARCKEDGVRPSSGLIGGDYDTGMCESFFTALEYVLIDWRQFRSQSEPHGRFHFIEGFSNPSCRHSAYAIYRPSNANGNMMASAAGLRPNPGITAGNSSTAKRSPRLPGISAHSHCPAPCTATDGARPRESFFRR
jgi:transposase InsO family protein